ncbi:hypothetical protein SAMN05421872_102123 [Nocardioides lianchengensis]|uniref:Transcriptional regulator, AbiEi antitoxin, Type IV TA system n=2 Tax=Nocardioides lianchengensis TaxID=1045774 RepID=A0A1G6L739_9ACTN|nr:hypothetical protein SAMN05421872_102123 [Nocardioides lianchengensis]
MRRQDGTISRAQLRQHGIAPHDLERLLRRRELVRILPGAFVDHTGRPTWSQRAWAGIHHFRPAALAGRSALRAALGPTWRHHDDTALIEIVVPAGVRRRPDPGYDVHRSRRYDDLVLAPASPPRVRVEHAALLVASTLGDLDAIQMLADVCQSRRTTATRVVEAAGTLVGLPRREWLTQVLGDIAGGTCSVLEHGYLHRVERPHSLPQGTRQRPVHGGRRDVEYREVGQVVELDGRLFHNTAAQRDADLERDLVAAVDRENAVRLGWGQVFDRPCHTAGRVGSLLTRRGWVGTLIGCSEACEAPGLWKS